MKKGFLFGLGILLATGVFAATIGTFDSDNVPTKDSGSTVSHMEFNDIVDQIKDFTAVFMGSVGDALNITIPKNVSTNTLSATKVTADDFCIGGDTNCITEWAAGGSDLENLASNIIPTRTDNATELRGDTNDLGPIVTEWQMGDSEHWFKEMWVEDLYIGNNTVSMGGAGNKVDVLSRSETGEVSLRSGTDENLTMKAEGVGNLSLSTVEGNIGIVIPTSFETKTISIQNDSLEGVIGMQATAVEIGSATDNTIFRVFGDMGLVGDIGIAGDLNFTGQLLQNGVPFAMDADDFEWTEGALSTCGDAVAYESVLKEKEAELLILQGVKAFYLVPENADSTKVTNITALIGKVQTDLNNITNKIIAGYTVPRLTSATSSTTTNTKTYLAAKKANIKVKDIECRNQFGEVVPEFYCADIAITRPSAVINCTASLPNLYSWIKTEFDICAQNPTTMTNRLDEAEQNAYEERDMIASLNTQKNSLPTSNTTLSSTSSAINRANAIGYAQRLGMTEDALLLDARSGMDNPPVRETGQSTNVVTFLEKTKNMFSFFPIAEALTASATVVDILREPSTYTVPTYQSRGVNCTGPSTAYCLDDKPAIYQNCADQMSDTYTWVTTNDNWVGGCVPTALDVISNERDGLESDLDSINLMKSISTNPTQRTSFQQIADNINDEVNELSDAETFRFEYDPRPTAGTRKRKVFCKLDTSAPAKMDDAYCFLSGNKPVSQQACTITPSPPLWFAFSSDTSCGNMDAITAKIIEQQGVIDKIDALLGTLSDRDTEIGNPVYTASPTTRDQRNANFLKREKDVIDAEDAKLIALKNKLQDEIDTEMTLTGPSTTDTTSWKTSDIECWSWNTPLVPWACAAATKVAAVVSCTLNDDNIPSWELEDMYTAPINNN